MGKGTAVQGLSLADVVAAKKAAAIKGEQHALWVGVKVEAPAVGYVTRFGVTQVSVVRAIFKG